MTLDSGRSASGADPPIVVETRTHRGWVRAVNEDRVAADPQRGLVVVADGVGGHRGGDVASRLAVDTMMEFLRADEDPVRPGEQRLRTAVGQAHERIIGEAEGQSGLYGMATTVVAGLFGRGRLHLVHVGDSRAYRFSEAGLEPLTRDHSLQEQLVEQGMFDSVGEAERAGVPPSVLVRALGLEENGAEPEITTLSVDPDQLFLFCTDGLTGMLGDAELADVLGDADAGLAERADRLVERALDRGGLDNVTLALVRIT